MSAPSWVPWVPAAASSHVTGRYTKRVYDLETQSFEEQHVEAACTVCKVGLKISCTSGRPREWIAKFAAVHRACKAP